MKNVNIEGIKKFIEEAKINRDVPMFDSHRLTETKFLCKIKSLVC
ncbi:MAG: hypothetical protein AB1638_05060 [Nitrospirota bacterium]